MTREELALQHSRSDKGVMRVCNHQGKPGCSAKCPHAVDHEWRCECDYPFCLNGTRVKCEATLTLSSNPKSEIQNPKSQ